MNDITQKTRTLLTLSMLKGVGPSALKRLGEVASFEEMSKDELASYSSSVSKAVEETGAWSKALDDADRQIEEANRFGARIISAKDDEYPEQLKSTKDDPYLIFVRGALAKISQRSVAIIGTREPTAHGVQIAQRIAEYFVSQQWSVVSGLAIGCDAIAHQAALDCGGHTVAVLAHGLHTIAPARHRKLAEDILASGGALVSEYRFGQAALPQQFVRRDRTQAGMAQGVVMIQSDVKGGSLHASRAALDYKRWLAVPYPTVLDRQNEEPKIQANLLIADGSNAQREDLLRCGPSSLNGIIILRNRDDYPMMIARTAFTSSAPAQGSLL